MNNKPYRCRDCNTQLQGNSRYCVLCYAKRHQPCPECMVQWADKTWHPRTKGRWRSPIDCAACRNERWILVED